MDRRVCNRFNNFDVWLTLKLHLNKVDPAGGARSEMKNDAGGTAKKIVKWGRKWGTWKSRFKRDVEKAWTGKFWLRSPRSFALYDFTVKGKSYRPNAWCRFRLELVGTAGAAHHSIDCVRLDASETFFRSHSRLYDHLDTKPKPQAHGSDKNTHVHEVGHLLGLGHIGQLVHPLSLEGLTCSAAALLNPNEGTNHRLCYGTELEFARDVMGSGSELHVHHAKPWQEAIRSVVGAIGTWDAKMTRHYPRSQDDILRNVYPTTRPTR